MAGRKSDFTLTKLDDLFTTQAQRDEEQLSKIRDIPLELIDDFPDHPFKVRDDEDMMQLVESVKERGVITPATVRQKEDGRYELVSGHRRKRACELAGFETLRSEIVDLNRDEATILMVESNFQRSEILPSEKAFVSEAEKAIADREAVEKEKPTKSKSEIIMEEAVRNPMQKEERANANPSVAKTDKSPLSRQNSEPVETQSDKGVAKPVEKPSVKEKLDRYKAQAKQQKEAERKEPEVKKDGKKPQQKNGQTLHRQPKKKPKTKER